MVEITRKSLTEELGRCCRLGDSSTLVAEYCTRLHCARVGLTSRGKCSTAILLRDLKVQAIGLLVSLVWVTTMTHHDTVTVVLSVSSWGTLKSEPYSLLVCPDLLKLCVKSLYYVTSYRFTLIQYVYICWNLDYAGRYFVVAVVSMANAMTCASF